MNLPTLPRMCFVGQVDCDRGFVMCYNDDCADLSLYILVCFPGCGLQGKSCVTGSIACATKMTLLEGACTVSYASRHVFCGASRL